MPASVGIQGLRGTGEFSTDFRPTNYREAYTLLEPNGDAPLNALLAMSQSESTDDPKYNNFRDHLPDRVVTVDGDVVGAATTVVLTDSDENLFIVPGTILVNSATGEVMHVSAYDDATVTLTVVRNIGGGSLTISNTNELFVAGFAAQEGGDTPTPISFDATVAYNYTQIFRESFSLTRTLSHTYLRTGRKYTELQEKALKLHMSDIERAMLFGKKHIINGSTSQPTRFTGGVINEITGVTDVGAETTPGLYTEESFDTLLIDTIFAYGSKEKLCFCGSTIAGHLQKFGKNRWAPQQVSGTYGVKFTRYQTFAGDLLVHVHPQFRQLPTMNSAMLCLDFPYLRYRYLEGSDTQLLTGRQGNGEDKVTDEYLTECGLELLQDPVHHYIKGWTLNAPAA